jgi:hypothetical protein
MATTRQSRLKRPGNQDADFRVMARRRDKEGEISFVEVSRRA